MIPLPQLLLVTDRKAGALPLVDAVALALGAVPPGTCAVLLREKDLPIRELVALARALRQVTQSRDSKLLVSGRLDAALLSEADGVHLGGEAPPFEAVRALAPASLLVGVSLHGTESPPPGASYALVAPIYETRSKPQVPALGLAALSRAGTPLYALGGIDRAERVRACLEAGAAGVAIRGAVLASSDPAAALRRLMSLGVQGAGR